MNPRLQLRHNYAVTLVVLNVGIGLCYLLQSSNRERSDAYHNARHITAWLPWMAALRWWGVLFLLVAVLVAVFHQHPTGLQVAGGLGSGLWVFWGILLASSAVLDGESGFVGAVLFTAGAIRHLQVARGR